MFIDQVVRMPSSTSHRPCSLLLVVLVWTTVGCNSYEPVKPIEGVFTPTLTAPNGSHCVQIPARHDGWLSYSYSEPVICVPTRVRELGLLTLRDTGGGREFTQEVGRVEGSSVSFFITTQRLREAGRFEYTDRSPALSDWTRHNPFSGVSP
jgi:hypothetical protein